MKKFLILFLLIPIYSFAWWNPFASKNLVFGAPTGSYYYANLLKFSTTTNGCLNGKTTASGVVTIYFTGSDCGTGTSGAFEWSVFPNYNATSTTLGLLNGFFSTASSTISGSFHLPALSDGLLKVSSGLVGTASNGTDYTLITATTCGGTDKVSAISANGTITCTADQSGVGGTGVGTISTSTSPTIGNLAMWASKDAYPEKLGTIGTSTPTISTGLTYSGTMGNLVGGISGNLTVNTSQNINTLSNLTSNGFIYTAGGTGALNVAASSSIFGYTPLNQSLYYSTTTHDTLTTIPNLSITKSQVSDFGSYLSSYDAWIHPVAGQSATSSLMLFNGQASSTLFSSNWLKVGGTASTTIDTTGNVSLPAAGTLTIPALTSGALAVDSAGKVYKGATTTAGVGLTYNGTNFAVNTSQNIATLSNLTSNGAILTSGGVGTLGIYTGTSCTNQFIRSLSGSIVATCASVANTDLVNSTISGVALGSNLANLTNDATLNGSAYNGSGAISDWGINLGNSNTWTVLQTFNYSSSTIYSSFATASTTNLTVSNNASTTLFSALTGWFTNASTTLFSSSYASSTNGFFGKLGIGTSSPFAKLSVGGNGSPGSILVDENTLSTSTSQTIDWTQGNSQLHRIGSAATTISFSNYTDGMTLKLIVCNPAGTAGAITWGTPVLWAGGTAPTQTTTANKCDVWSFIATQATSTLKIFGAQSANF